MRAFRLIAALPALSAMFLASAISSASADVKRDINDLKQTSYQSRKDIADNRKEILRLRDELKQMKVDMPSGQSMEAIRNSQKTLLTRLNDLHEEIQSILSQVENELNEAKKLSRSNAADIDVVKASAGGGSDLEKRVTALEMELALIKKKLEIREEAPAESSGEDEAESTTESPAGSPEAQYKAAYDLYKNRKYLKAREAFVDFLKTNKAHKWAGNAQFWIGETYYSEKEYEKAILSYDDVVRKYPSSNKVPDSMLKQGYAFLKLKDPLAAKGVLRSLVQKHPESRAAGLAREKLKSLK